VLLGLALALAGCGSAPHDDGVSSSGFNLEQVAKSDIDMVAETHLGLSLGYLQELTAKLYRRNPQQWRRAGHASVEAAVIQVFGRDRPVTFAALGHRRSVAAMHLAFDPGYAGDRVLAFSEGLRTMLLDAYGGKREFYLTDSFDPQRLYLAARNLEIAMWKLGHDRDAAGRLLLLSNATDGPVLNLSFERLFGKLIALQDAMAQVIADTTNRQIKNVIQGMASAVFFPI
jgi:hypothetical protein